MSDFEPALVARLVTYGRSRVIGGRVDAVRDDVLDFAFDELEFDGDQVALWNEVKLGIQSAPATAPTQRTNPRRDDAEPKAEPWNPMQDATLVTAPYRFTPVNSKVSRRNGAGTPLNLPVAGKLSAVVDVVWQVETPLLIGETLADGTKVHPFKLGDDFAIPGATLRGAIRAVTETIAFGRMFQINRHKRFALRDFVHPTYKAFITSGQGIPGLQAGWLKKTDAGPQITPCDWGYVAITDIIGSSAEADIRAWIQKDRGAKYQDRRVDWQSPAAFTVSQPFAFKGVTNDRKLYAQAASKQTGSYVFSGKLPGAARGEIKKQFEYVFLDTPASPVSLHPDAWERFETTNCKPSQNKRAPDGAWKEFCKLYESRGRVPVFFVGDLKDSAAPEFSFGLTRLYRIPHAQSVGDLLLNSADKMHRPAEYDGNDLVLKPDFVEHLFGYVYEPKDLTFGHGLEAQPKDFNPPKEVARKGRVSFEFAHPAPAARFQLWPEAGPITTIMGAPKPSFAPFYLVGTEKDYSASSEKGWPQLAGRKRYITRFRAGTKDEPLAPLQTALDRQNANVAGDVKSHLRFLAPIGDSAFVGRIRLHNVSPEELGSLLWALSFGGNPKCRHMIGRGKAFGAGQIFASQITLNIRRNDAAGKPDSPEIWKSSDGREKLKPWLDAFERAIAPLLGFATVDTWRNSPEVRALLDIASPRGWTAPGTSYLPYQPAGGRQGESFAALRKKTGLGVARNDKSVRPPARLLTP